MTPFSFTGSLNLPGDVGLAPDAIPVNFSSAFDSAAEFVLSLTGSGVKSVPLGSIGSPGTKAILVKMDSSATAQPILLAFNGSTTGRLEVSPGGFVMYGNPVPAAGVSQLDVVFTTACIVRIWVLG